MAEKDYDIEQLIGEMTATLEQHLSAAGRSDPLVIGIQTGGLWIAEPIRRGLGVSTPLGAINIAFYRDDFSRIGMHPRDSAYLPSSLAA